MYGGKESIIMKKFSYKGKCFTLQFLSVVGSTLHGLNTKDSDVDYKAVFTWDKSVLFSMRTYLSQLNKDNTDKDEWCYLLSQLNKEFNLNLKSDDDLVLFSAKEFFELSYKNDSNMFDMLYSDEEFVLYQTEKFLEVRKNKEKFLNLYKSYNRYFGMSNNCFNLYKKGLNKNKNLAKSFQMLYVLELLLKDKKHYCKLPEELNLELKQIREGNVNYDEMLVKYQNLKEKLDSMEYEEVNNQDMYLDYMDNLLVNLYES